MKVHELMEALEVQDPGAEVRIMEQLSWPFENAIASVIVRAEFESPDQIEREGQDFSDRGGRQHEENDVFLVKGSQLCYGNKDAWQ